MLILKRVKDFQRTPALFNTFNRYNPLRMQQTDLLGNMNIENAIKSFYHAIINRIDFDYRQFNSLIIFRTLDEICVYFSWIYCIENIISVILGYKWLAAIR